MESRADLTSPAMPRETPSRPGAIRGAPTPSTNLSLIPSSRMAPCGYCGSNTNVFAPKDAALHLTELDKQIKEVQRKINEMR